MIHPWKDVPTGEQMPHVVNTVVEIPQGGTLKYELDKATGMLRMDRVLHSAVHFPANYGFIPQTIAEDNDPLDILILCQYAIFPLTLIEARPIGTLNMVDAGKNDHKIIAVAVEDPEYGSYEVIDELPQHRLKTITRFFRDYKQLEPTEIDVRNLQSIEQTYAIITEAAERFRS